MSLQTLTRWALQQPKRVLVLAALAAAAAEILGVPVASHLTAGGFLDPGAGSARANQTLTEVFGKGDVQLILVLGHPDGARADDVTAAGRRIVDVAQDNPNVLAVVSPWNTPQQAGAALYSDDGEHALVVLELRGGESQGPGYATDLVDAVNREVLTDFGAVTMQAGGSAMVFAQITGQTLRDVLIMESIAVPLSLLVLIWVFLRSDMSVQLVVANSHSAKPWLYKFSGAWGNHEGSMLLWVFILTLCAASVAVLTLAAASSAFFWASSLAFTRSSLVASFSAAAAAALA